MVDIVNYEGREQAFIKHFFFKNYIETLFFRVAMKFDEIVYIDGFSGPWQNNDDKFQDTSFGIALNAMRMVKAHYKAKGREIKFTAHLVEKASEAYNELSKIPAKYPNLNVNTYNDDFLEVVGELSKKVHKNSYCFVFIDPKGWKVDLKKLSPLLSHKNSEVIFNFMFDFINRFVTHENSGVAESLDRLFPYTVNWRGIISKCNTPTERKDVIFEEFAKNLAQIGNFEFVSQTEILKPTKDRALYALFYATRNGKGIEVFRHEQVKALKKQIETRGETKLKNKQMETGQNELFGSANEYAPSQTEEILQSHENEAKNFILQVVPNKPASILYEDLRLETAKRFIVNFATINKISKDLMDEKLIEFPNWESNRRRPQSNYRVQK